MTDPPQVPSQIETECGTATIGKISGGKSDREFLCPLCDTLIDVGEDHLVAIPMVVPGLRRHLHTGCLEKFLEYDLEIKLHPKEPDAVRYYLFDKVNEKTHY